MNSKHHGLDLSLEGLTFIRKFNPKTESDHSMCLKMLLEYGADLALDPHARLRNTKKRPTPIFQAIRSEQMLRVVLDYTQNKPALLN